MILIKHFETESTEPVKKRNPSPKLQLKDLQGAFKRQDPKEFKRLKNKFTLKNIERKRKVESTDELLAKRSKSIETDYTPEKRSRMAHFVNPSQDFQTIMTMNDDPSRQKLLRYANFS